MLHPITNKYESATTPIHIHTHLIPKYQATFHKLLELLLERNKKRGVLGELKGGDGFI